MSKCIRHEYFLITNILIDEQIEQWVGVWALARLYTHNVQCICVSQQMICAAVKQASLVLYHTKNDASDVATICYNVSLVSSCFSTLEVETFRSLIHLQRSRTETPEPLKSKAHRKWCQLDHDKFQSSFYSHFVFPDLFRIFCVGLVYNLIMVYERGIQLSSWMVSVDFTKDGCDSVSPSTNIRRLPFPAKTARTSPLPAKRSKTSKAPGTNVVWAWRLMDEILHHLGWLKPFK